MNRNQFIEKLKSHLSTVVQNNLLNAEAREYARLASHIETGKQTDRVETSFDQLKNPPFPQKRNPGH